MLSYTNGGIMLSVVLTLMVAVLLIDHLAFKHTGMCL